MIKDQNVCLFASANGMRGIGVKERKGVLERSNPAANFGAGPGILFSKIFWQTNLDLDRNWDLYSSKKILPKKYGTVGTKYITFSYRI